PLSSAESQVPQPHSRRPSSGTWTVKPQLAHWTDFVMEISVADFLSVRVEYNREITKTRKVAGVIATCKPRLPNRAPNRARRATRRPIRRATGNPTAGGLGRRADQGG